MNIPTELVRAIVSRKPPRVSVNIGVRLSGAIAKCWKLLKSRSMPAKDAVTAKDVIRVAALVTYLTENGYPIPVTLMTAEGPQQIPDLLAHLNAFGFGEAPTPPTRPINRRARRKDCSAQTSNG